MRYHLGIFILNAALFLFLFQSCSYFASNAFPLKLVFKNSNPKADPIYVMYKVQ